MSEEFKPSWLAKLFGQAPNSVQAIILDLARIKIVSSTNIEEILYTDISEITSSKRWWWWQITLLLHSERIISLGGMTRRKFNAIDTLLQEYKTQYIEAIRIIED